MNGLDLGQGSQEGRVRKVIHRIILQAAPHPTQNRRRKVTQPFVRQATLEPPDEPSVGDCFAQRATMHGHHTEGGRR